MLCHVASVSQHVQETTQRLGAAFPSVVVVGVEAVLHQLHWRMPPQVPQKDHTTEIHPHLVGLQHSCLLHLLQKLVRLPAVECLAASSEV